MKKKILSRIVIGLSLVLTGILTSKVMFTNAAGDFASGNGTKDNPYIIKTAEQLQNINKYCGDKSIDKYFKLANDIDASKIKNFNPICQTENQGFKGVLDGNNKTIKNLKIDVKTSNVGLFGRVGPTKEGEEASIKNLTIDKNSSIKTTGDNVGSVAGYIWNAKIVNIENRASITVTGGNNVGGIVGYTDNNSYLLNVYNKGNIDSIMVATENKNIKNNPTFLTDIIIKTGGLNVGGIVGISNGSDTIEYASNIGNISGISGVGGIVGKNKPSNLVIKKAYNTGNFSTSNNNLSDLIQEMFEKENKKTNKNKKVLEVLSENIEYTEELSVCGGIVGLSEGSTIENVYNSGKINDGSRMIGGIAGWVTNNSSFTNVVNYSTPNYKPLDNGLLIGGNHTLLTSLNVINGYTIAHSDVPVFSSQLYKEGDSQCVAAEGKSCKINVNNTKTLTKEELKKKENFSNLDFENVWEMGSEYPVLREYKTTNNENEETVNQTGYSDTNLTIKYNNNIIDVLSYLYKDRTYVELYTFCDETGICDVGSISKTVNKKKHITYKVIKENEENYDYIVEHIKGSDTFKATIIIGGRKIVNDKAQVSDVSSCPDEITDETFQCGDNKFFVPVRFLTQALGLKVVWDGSTYTVNINDTFETTFNDVYATVITEGKCVDNISNCTELEKNSNGYYKLSKNKNYYLNVIERKTGKIQTYSKFFSFYDSGALQKGNKEPYTYVTNPFSIKSNQIQVTGNLSMNIDVAQVVIYEITGNEENYQKTDYNIGTYPMVINAKFKY